MFDGKGNISINFSSGWGRADVDGQDRRNGDDIFWVIIKH